MRGMRRILQLSQAVVAVVGKVEVARNGAEGQQPAGPWSPSVATPSPESGGPVVFLPRGTLAGKVWVGS